MKTKNRHARISIKDHGPYHTVISLKNTQGQFVHVVPAENRFHRKQKLILRLPGVGEVNLNGRQVASLRRVLQQTG